MFKTLNSKIALGTVVATMAVFAGIAFVGSNVYADGVDPNRPNLTPTEEMSESEDSIMDSEENMGSEASETDAPTEEPTEEPEVTEVEDVATSETEEGFVVDLAYEEPVQVGISTAEACSFVDRITVRTSAPVNGRIKVSNIEMADSSAEETEEATSEESSEQKEEEQSEFENTFGECTFELIDISNDDIASVEWRLKANRDTVVDAGLDRDDLALQQEIADEEGNTSWEEAGTERSEGDSDNFIYTATTDNFGNGRVTLTESQAGIFTLSNLLICLGLLVGLLVLGLAAYALTNRDKSSGSKPATSTASANSSSPNTGGNQGGGKKDKKKKKK